MSQPKELESQGSLSRRGILKAASACAAAGAVASFSAFAWSAPSPRRQTLVFDTESKLVDDPRGEERRLFAKVPWVQQGS
jgi:para-nitrobenzyl esterase